MLNQYKIEIVLETEDNYSMIEKIMKWMISGLQIFAEARVIYSDIDTKAE